MPPRARPRRPEPEAESDVAKHAKDGELCSDCWPEGWPGNDSGATCIHGTWTR